MAERIDHGLARAAADVLRNRIVDPVLRTRMRGLPAMLQTSGLAVTCAFLLSKAETHGPKDAYWLTAKVLLDAALTEAGLDAELDPRRMLDTLTCQATDRQYVIAETRASMLALWLSRLTQAKAADQGTNGQGADAS